jgi:hypothetical protein
MANYNRLNRIIRLHKIAEEKDFSTQEISTESSEKKPEDTLSLFTNKSAEVLNGIKKIASRIPFAAEILSLYYYVLDTNQNIIFRAAVAAFLMAITGVITAEAATSFISGLSAVVTAGLATPFVSVTEVILKGIGAGTLLSAIPYVIAIYNLLVEDEHLEQAKEFLNSANIKTEDAAINKAAREFAIQGNYKASYALIKVALGRKGLQV